MKILVLSHSWDDHLSLVVPHLEGREFVLYSDKSFTFHFDPKLMELLLIQEDRRLQLSEISSVWNRRAFSIPGKEQPHQRFTRLETKACVLESLVNAIPFECWINHPDAIQGARDKTRVLNYARQCGLRCPEWIVSNKTDCILDFSNKMGGWVVLKPLVSVPDVIDFLPTLLYARPISEKELRDRLSEKFIFPIFVQQRIKKSADWRITIVDNHISSVRMTGCPIESLDFRRSYDTLKYENRLLRNDILISTRKLMAMLRLRYGAIDMVEDEETKELYFLEINVGGQFGWMEEAAGLGGQSSFSKSLAKALLSNTQASS